jgi:hypothetical protein
MIPVDFVIKKCFHFSGKCRKRFKAYRSPAGRRKDTPQNRSTTTNKFNIRQFIFSCEN